MTLREYLEKQIVYFSDVGNEYPEGHQLHWYYHGYSRAYKDVLDKCLSSILNTQILTEVW